MENLPRPIGAAISLVVLYFTFQWHQSEGSYEALITLILNIGVCLGLAWSTYKQFSNAQTTDQTQELSNRDILINTVQRNWIEGVLHDALRDAEIQLKFEGKPEKVADSMLYSDYVLPIYLVSHDGRTRKKLKRSVDILLNTFNQIDRKLLILGAPGSGKTVLMLQLAEKLLEDAHKGKPIPLIFNLSSWSNLDNSFEDWIIFELRRNYNINRKNATKLIHSDSLIYLMDGFDEVITDDLRSECLKQLNEFISPTRQIIICSRIEEYQTLAKPLNTKFAIELQPLSDTQFRYELIKHIPLLETTDIIIKTLRVDEKVWMEVKKPLFINVIINTYSDGKPFAEHNIKGNIREKLQHLIIEPYIRRQLQNQASAEIDNANTLYKLSWISYNLYNLGLSVFYIEMIQSFWLPIDISAKTFRLLIPTVIALSSGIIFGLYGLLNIGIVEGGSLLCLEAYCLLDCLTGWQMNH